MSDIRIPARHVGYRRLARTLFAVAITLALLPSRAFTLDVPAMRGPVNDLARIMSDDERASLESYLVAASEQTGVQVAILTVNSLEGEAIESYSMRVAEAWKLGQADKDNGALIVVAMEDRAIRIEVGYGIEESLTDAKCGLIIRSVIAPAFRKGEYGSGIIEAARNVVGIATGNAEIVSENVRNPGSDSADSGGLGIGAVIFVIFVILMSLGGRRRGRRGPDGLLWGLLLGSLLSSGRRDHWSGGSGGGFGGGGFSGGGGGFGGGGASGGW